MFSRLLTPSRRFVVPTAAPFRGITSISCGFYRTTPPATLFSTSPSSASSSSWSVREQEELPQSEKRFECGLSASDPDSQISRRQPKPVHDEMKTRLMHEDFDGRDSLQIALDPKAQS